MRYGFVIDQTRCIGCHACTVACKEENGVPLGVFRTWVKYIERGEFPGTQRRFAVLRCNHCDSAPCVTICPTRALFRRPDGIVDLDHEACIGCKSCLQACPYDALYIDPESHTAAKCHFCAHRVEMQLEPACVIVCPERAILAGDLDDPASVVSRTIARHEVAVRKPEQGTRPKLFYVGADAAALNPQAQESGRSYLWAERVGEPPAPALGGEAQARTVYDIPRQPRPWGWRVSAYLWTKSVAAGAALVAGAGALVGWPPARGLALPLVAMAFLAATTVLLVADLKRPDRFHYVLLRPNLGSWLVWGAWILVAFGGATGLWMLGVATGPAASFVLVALALLAAGYSAFLFAQAEGRDFWQSPFLLPQLLVAAITAGAAVALLLHGPVPAFRQLLRSGLGMSLALVLTECFVPRRDVDAMRAARHITAGPGRLIFWVGVIAAGTLLPLVLLVLPASRASASAAALLALGGLYLWEDRWVRAGQACPLS